MDLSKVLTVPEINALREALEIAYDTTEGDDRAEVEVRKTAIQKVLDLIRPFHIQAAIFREDSPSAQMQSAGEWVAKELLSLEGKMHTDDRVSMMGLSCDNGAVLLVMVVGPQAIEDAKQRENLTRYFFDWICSRDDDEAGGEYSQDWVDLMRD